VNIDKMVTIQAWIRKAYMDRAEKVSRIMDRDWFSFDDLPIPDSGFYRPAGEPVLYYYSLIERAWCPVLEIDDTGQSILMYITVPDGATVSIIVHRLYTADMRFSFGLPEG
jgi:hypothetical protein